MYMKKKNLSFFTFTLTCWKWKENAYLICLIKKNRKIRKDKMDVIEELAWFCCTNTLLFPTKTAVIVDQSFYLTLDWLFVDYKVTTIWCHICVSLTGSLPFHFALVSPTSLVLRKESAPDRLTSSSTELDRLINRLDSCHCMTTVFKNKNNNSYKKRCGAWFLIVLCPNFLK